MIKYDVNNVSVETLLGYVEGGIIAIPEIQRPFVWNTTKVRDLIDSLYREYPVGYIITWKSQNAKLKDGSASEGKHILIDGQQRITALEAALLGKEVLTNNYKKKRIKIAFNLQTEEFQTSNPAIQKQEEWIPDIAEVMKSGFNTFEFVKNYADTFNLDANEVSKKMTKLQSIKNIMLGRIELSSMLDIATVAQIFERVNSSGVPLSQADFVMSRISVNEKYEGNDIRKTIDYFCHFAKTPNDYENIKNHDVSYSSKEIFNKILWIKDKNENVYLPSYDAILRVAFTYQFKRGKLQDLVSLLSGYDSDTKKYKEEIVEDSYKKLYEGVKAFINQTNFERYTMILKSAGIIDESLVGSKNVINFGYILYLLLREKNVAPDLIEKLVRKWVIMSILTQRYASSVESQFDSDIKKLNKADDIEQYIKEEEERELSDSFWDNILVENLNNSGTNSPYWKTYLIAQIKLNDRAFLSKDINVKTLIEGRGDIHHIFPKNYLQKNGKNNKTVYNQIANFAMLQSEINIQISNNAPNIYMKDVVSQCNNSKHEYGAIDNMDDLRKNMEENCIPEILINMDVNDYEDFLVQRRVLMAQKLKKYYESL